MQTTRALGVFARDLLEEDLVDCLSVNPARIGEETVGRARAMEIWKSIIRFPAWTSAVVEAPRPIAGHRIVGFGGDVWVSQAFAEAEISNPRPGLNSRVIASIDRRRPVVLSEREIRAGNTKGGLDMVILYGSWRRSVLPPTGVSEVCGVLAARFLELHSGFQVNRVITETMDDDERSQYLATHAWREVSKFEGPDRETVIDGNDA